MRVVSIPQCNALRDQSPSVVLKWARLVVGVDRRPEGLQAQTHVHGLDAVEYSSGNMQKTFFYRQKNEGVGAMRTNHDGHTAPMRTYTISGGVHFRSSTRKLRSILHHTLE